MTMKHLLPVVLLTLAGSHVVAQPITPATAGKALETQKTIAAASKTKTEKSDGKADKLSAAPTSVEPAAAAGDRENKSGLTDGVQIAPMGRRDPFRPITLNVRAASTRRRENLSPLERFEIGQLKLVGIVWNVKGPTALVEDSSGLGYSVKVGTPIGANDGKVKEIRREGLIVEEFFVDLYGAKKRREVPMPLPVEQ